jgi:hypothetical protein
MEQYDDAGQVLWQAIGAIGARPSMSAPAVEWSDASAVGRHGLRERSLRRDL